MITRKRLASYRKLIEQNKKDLTKKELEQIDLKIEKRMLERQIQQ
ncbi:hypothetical protein [Heyndrickxia acidicola]|uniref:FbpB family small basic protein n=1 Tax=Heyndrickxia acidicola TaxID=209389 RepID=A0ABU6MA02_9BACI|nr:hypothetical protein [Heyndrickxia acidicola]MED1201503.1 hypothetical protein [Heyndrickxia acidicola]